MLQQLPTDILNYLLEFVDDDSMLQLTCSQFCTSLQLKPHTDIIAFLSAFHKVRPTHVSIFRVYDPLVYLPYIPNYLYLSRCDSSGKNELIVTRPT